VKDIDIFAYNLGGSVAPLMRDPQPEADPINISPAQLANLTGGFATGSGIADIFGEYPAFPTNPEMTVAEMTAGPRGPSLLENIRNRELLDAGLQVAGGIGDLFPPAMAAIAPMRAARAASKAEKIAELRKEANKARFGDDFQEPSERIQRASRLGFNMAPEGRLYHASKQDITELKSFYPDGMIYTTPDPEFAENWLGKGKFRERQDGVSVKKEKERKKKLDDEFEEKAKGLSEDEILKLYDEEYDKKFQEIAQNIRDADKVIYPLVSKTKKPFVPHKDVDVLEEFFGSEKMSEPFSPADNMPTYKDALKSGNFILYENKEMVDFLKGKGYDSMFLREDTVTNPKKIAEKPQDVPYETFAVFDPKDLRSPFAKFDPDEIESPDILKAEGGEVSSEDVDIFDYLPSSTQLAYFGSQLLPGSATIDASGKMAGMPTGDADITDIFSSDPNLSLAENIRQGNLGTAALQGLGVAGDVLQATPFAAVGTALKVPQATAKTLKLASKSSITKNDLLDDFFEKQVALGATPKTAKSNTTRYKKTLTKPAVFNREKLRLEGEIAQFDPSARVIVSPEALSNKVLVPVVGDRSVSLQGRGVETISEVKGVPLSRAVPLQGGPDYTIANQAQGRGWASMEGVAQSKQNNMIKAAERTGLEPIGVYSAMSREGIDFSAPIASAMVAQIPALGLSKKAIKEFDDAVRAGVGTSIDPIPDFVGVTSPDVFNQLLGEGGFPRRGAGEIRKAVVQHMKKAKFRDLGFPIYDDIVQTATSPPLANIESGSSGYSMFSAQPDIDIFSEPLHQSYNMSIPGTYIGGLQESIPPEIMFPDTMKMLSESINKAGQPFTRREQIGALERKHLYEPMTDEKIDNMIRYMNEKLGTDYAQGGAVNTDDIDIFEYNLGGSVSEMIRNPTLEREELLTPEQAAYLATVMTVPGSGIADISGNLPAMPTAEDTDIFGGEPLPSLAQNIESGKYLDAALQALAGTGDAAAAIPLFGGGVRALLTAPRAARLLQYMPDPDAISDLDRMLRSTRINPEVRQAVRSHPAVTRVVAQMHAIPETKLAKGYGTKTYFATRRFNIDGREVVGIDNALEQMYDKLKRLGWDDDRVPYTGTVKGGNKNPVATIILGPPAAGKSMIANPLARKYDAAILDPDEVKKIMPEFAEGIGSNATHVESKRITQDLRDLMIANRNNIVVPTVGAKPEKISRQIADYKKAGYKVNLVDVAVPADEALRRMLLRFLGSNKLIPPDYLIDEVGDLPSQTYNLLRRRGEADAYARIDNSVGIDVPKPLNEDTGDIFTNAEIRLRVGGR